MTILGALLIILTITFALDAGRAYKYKHVDVFIARFISSLACLLLLGILIFDR